MKIFPSTLRHLEHALNAASVKQRVISSNIANVDTPNYKSQKIDFQSELHKAMGKQHKGLTSYRTHVHHLPFSTQNSDSLAGVKVVNRAGSFFNHNGNTVDIDLEMAEMAKNQLWQSAIVERVNGQFNSLRTVINEGK